MDRQWAALVPLPETVRQHAQAAVAGEVEILPADKCSHITTICGMCWRSWERLFEVKLPEPDQDDRNVE